jgi:aminoglycoside phosphotransferase (APT) family kinase protein
MLFGPDDQVAAAIDWELAGLGPGEADLGWWLFFDGLFSDAMGVERLPGLPGREETIAIYEAASGRQVANMEYFEVLANVEMSIIGLRQFDRQVGFGLIPATSSAYLNNPISAMLAEKLGLPIPEVGEDFAELMRASAH